LNLLFGHDDAVAEWVSKQPYGKPFHQPFSTFGVVDEAGHIRAGFVFTGFTGDTVEMSLAADRWRWRSRDWRGALAAMLHYVFEQCGCSRLQVHTSASNKGVRKQLPRMGFRFEGTCRRMYGKENGLQYSLTVDDLPAFREKWKI